MSWVRFMIRSSRQSDRSFGLTERGFSDQHWFLARKRLRRDQLLQAFKTSTLTMVLVAWSAFAMAQTPPGGTPGTPAPSGATTGEGMDWLWIIGLIALVAVLLFYFLGRNRGTRI